MTASGIKVPANKQLAVTMRIDNLTTFGKFQGIIRAEIAGKYQRVGTVVVERYPIPMLKIVGATDPGGIKIVQTEPAFLRVFRIESSNTAPVDRLHVSAVPFVGPDGSQVATEFKLGGSLLGKAIAVSGLGAVELQVSATLQQTGDYAGAVTLIYGDKRESVTLNVKRERPDLSVDLLGLETARGVSCCGYGDATWRLTVQETGWHDVKLDQPQLVDLALKTANAAKVQGGYEKLIVQDENGKSVTFPLTVPAGKSRELRLTVHGLESAGQYDGQLLVTGGDAKSIKHAVTLLMKDNGWIAAGLIALGVFISWGIRVWVKYGRPRVKQLRQVQVLTRQLEELQAPVDLTEEERDLLGLSRRRLDQLYDGATATSREVAEARFTSVAVQCILT